MLSYPEINVNLLIIFYSFTANLKNKQMKKLGLFFALFSLVILSSCKKEEEENTTVELTLEQKIIGTWNSEISRTFSVFTETETGTMTFYEDGTGLEVYDEDDHDHDDHDDEGHDEDEDDSFTWSINSEGLLTLDFDGDEVTLSNDVNQADSLVFSGTMELEDEEDEEGDYDEGEIVFDGDITDDIEVDGEGEIDLDLGLDDIFSELMTVDVTLTLTK